MRNTVYDPSPYAQHVPGAGDTPTPYPGRLSDVLEERHALAAWVPVARAVAQAAPEVRQAKVDAARRAIQEGTLTLDGPVLAATLLQAVRGEHRHACV
jgi:hypothetical protein